MATDISTGSRLAFTQGVFDSLCSDLGPFSLSRAAAASSAVPVVLSAVTINNYGGTCNFTMPKWLTALADSANPPRPAARAARRLREFEGYSDSARRPFIHLVDGGVSDNLGLRGVLEVIEAFEALHSLGQPTPLDHVHRIIVFVVNSLSIPSTKWNESENPPGTIDILVKSAGVPIDRYSGEMVEQLKDIDARWTTLRRIRRSLPGEGELRRRSCIDSTTTVGSDARHGAAEQRAVTQSPPRDQNPYRCPSLSSIHFYPPLCNTVCCRCRSRTHENLRHNTTPREPWIS